MINKHTEKASMICKKHYNGKHCDIDTCPLYSICTEKMVASIEKENDRIRRLNELAETIEVN